MSALDNNLKNYKFWSEEQKRSARRSVINSFASDPGERNLADFIDLARTNPEAFADIYCVSGESSSYNSGGSLYRAVYEKCRNSPVSEGIFVVQAMLRRLKNKPSEGLGPVPYGKPESITKLSSDKAAALAYIVALGKSYNDRSYGPAESEALQYTEKMYENGNLINYDAKVGYTPQSYSEKGISAAEVRKEINKHITAEQVEHLDTKFVKDFVAADNEPGKDGKTNKVLSQIVTYGNNPRFFSANPVSSMNISDENAAKFAAENSRRVDDYRSRYYDIDREAVPYIALAGSISHRISDYVYGNSRTVAEEIKDYAKNHKISEKTAAKELMTKAVSKEIDTYNKTKELLVSAAEQLVEKHDAANRGALKTVSRRFEEFADKLYPDGKAKENNANNGYYYNRNAQKTEKKANAYIEASEQRANVFYDAYLSAIYKDIDNMADTKGMTAEEAAKHKLVLGDNAKKALIIADTDGYYLRKINEKQPETAKELAAEYEKTDYNRASAKRARDVANFVVNKEQTIEESAGERYYQFKGESSQAKITPAEKEAYAEAEAAYHENKWNTAGKEKQQKLDEYNRLEEEADGISRKINTAEAESKALYAIQGAYGKVFDRTKNRKPEGKEAGLSRANVEKTLENFPVSYTPLAKPDEKAPLLFGGKVKERLEALENAINEFNKTVKKYSEELSGKADMTGFKGRMLDPESVKKAKEPVSALERERTEVYYKQRSLGLQAPGQEQEAIDSMKNRKEAVDKKLEDVKQLIADKKEHAHERVSMEALEKKRDEKIAQTHDDSSLSRTEKAERAQSAKVAQRAKQNER